MARPRRTRPTVSVVENTAMTAAHRKQATIAAVRDAEERALDERIVKVLTREIKEMLHSRIDVDRSNHSGDIQITLTLCWGNEAFERSEAKG